jgi:peptide/nickel transport system substrate-binding protein
MGDTRHMLLGAGIAAAMFTTGGTLTYYEGALPTTLNPLYAAKMVDYRAQEMVFDRLWLHSPINNDLESRLVANWELAEAGKAIKLELKPSLKWHDGEAFTSRDVCFTVKALLDRGTPSPIAEGYRTVLAGCEELGKTTALIRFTRVIPNPRERLGFVVLPEHVFDGNTSISPDVEFSSHPIGTGPMKGNKGARGVTFTAYPNGHHNPVIQQAQLQEGGDPILAIKAIVNNAVQGIIEVAPMYRAEVSSSDELALKSYDLRSWWFIAINTKKAPLDDVRVRSALNHILDRTELREKAVGVKPGERNSPCEFISGPFVPSSPFYNREVATVERSDLHLAEGQLKSAGLQKVGGRWNYKGQPISFQIGMEKSLDNEATDILSMIANQFEAAGVGAQVYKIPPDKWTTEAVTGRMASYDLLVGKWSFGQVEDVNDLFNTRRSGQGTRNIFNYSDAEIDALLTQYEAAKTDTAARDAYHDLHKKLADKLPYLFLWKLDTKSAWRTEVKDNTISPYFYFTNFDSWRFEG